jgi:hypothetical protein
MSDSSKRTVIIKAGGDPNFAEWLASASDADIALAVELGRPAVIKLKEIVSQLCVTPPDQRSRQLGEIGEGHVESILRERFINVDNVASCAKSGDLSLCIRNRRIMVEVKNYSSPVPSSGVEKFRRDLMTTAAHGGVFISLNTPITCFTEEFAIRYESGQNGVTIPCAYITSSESNSIIIACQMISNIIQFFDYAAANLHDSDKIKENVYNITRNLSDISHARDKFQCLFTKISADLLNVMLQFSTAEGRIRAQTDAMLAELSHADVGGQLSVLEELGKNAHYMRYKPESKDHLRKIVTRIHGGREGSMRDDMNINAWKIGAKRFVNNRTEIGINFTTTKVDITVPRSRLTGSFIAETLGTLGKKITIDSDKLCVELDSSTVDYILDKVIAPLTGGSTGPSTTVTDLQ